MNQLDKRIEMGSSMPNNSGVALASNGTHAVAAAASGAGLHASHGTLINS